MVRDARYSLTVNAFSSGMLFAFSSFGCKCVDYNYIYIYIYIYMLLLAVLSWLDGWSEWTRTKSMIQGAVLR